MWAKAPTAHCCSKGCWHHLNPGCSRVYLGLNKLFCPSSQNFRQGRFGYLACLWDFSPGCQTCCTTTVGLTSTDHLLSRLAVLHLVLHASLMGKSWPEIEQPFPRLPVLRAASSIPVCWENPIRNSGVFPSVFSLLVVQPIILGLWDTSTNETCQSFAHVSSRALIPSSGRGAVWDEAAIHLLPKLSWQCWVPSHAMGKRWSWTCPAGAGQQPLPISSKTKCVFGPGELCVEQRLKAQSVSFHLLLDNCCDLTSLTALLPDLSSTSSQSPAWAVDIFLLISFM